MKFRTHRCVINTDSVEFIDQQLDSQELRNALEDFEDEVAHLYQLMQEGKIGIKKLGSEIRKSSQINSIFDTIYDKDTILIKLTMNRAGFYKAFINSFITHPDKNIFFLISSRDFNRDSQLFDSSHPTIEQIKTDLVKLVSIFSPKNITITSHFIEIISFSRYLFDNSEGYSKIYRYE